MEWKGYRGLEVFVTTRFLLILVFDESDQVSGLSLIFENFENSKVKSVIDILKNEP